MGKFEQDFERLCAEGDTAGPVSDDAIREAETQLGVVFPEEYRDFLGKNGALLALGMELYGLPDALKNDPPLWQDVVNVTTELRARWQIGTENPYFVALADDGFDTYFFLDTQCSPATKIWAIGPDAEVVVSESLHEFVVEYVA